MSNIRIRLDRDELETVMDELAAYGTRLNAATQPSRLDDAYFSYLIKLDLARQVFTRLRAKAIAAASPVKITVSVSEGVILMECCNRAPASTNTFRDHTLKTLADLLHAELCSPKT